MYGSYNSKDEVKSAVLQGQLNIFDLECVAKKHPDYVDNDLMVTAYNYFIKEIVDRGSKILNEDGTFANVMVDINHADEVIAEAMGRGYSVDTNPFETLVERIYNAMQHDFVNSSALLKIFEKSSSLDFDNYKDAVNYRALKGAAFHA